MIRPKREEYSADTFFSTAENEMLVSFFVTYSEEEVAKIMDFDPF